MSETVFVPGQYDPNTPRTSHNGLTAAMFADTLRNADGPILNVAAGETDLQADLHNLHIDKAVVALDPAYADLTPGDRRYNSPWFAPAVAQEIPYDDETFAMTVCQFGAQHVPADQLGAALRDMVRVTMTARSPRDAARGVVFVNPVFDVKRLEQSLERLGLPDMVGINRPDTNRFAQRNRKDVLPTLWLHKTADMTPERLEAIIAAVTETGALRTKRVLGEVVSRVWGGQSYK